MRKASAGIEPPDPVVVEDVEYDEYDVEEDDEEDDDDEDEDEDDEDELLEGLCESSNLPRAAAPAAAGVRRRAREIEAARRTAASVTQQPTDHANRPTSRAMQSAA